MLHKMRKTDVLGLELTGHYWLFQAAKSAVSHADEFKQLYMYYTTRACNPLKKMQSLIVIACKILRVLYTIPKPGIVYAPQKLLKDIKHLSVQASMQHKKQ